MGHQAIKAAVLKILYVSNLKKCGSTCRVVHRVALSTAPVAVLGQQSVNFWTFNTVYFRTLWVSSNIKCLNTGSSVYTDNNSVPGRSAIYGEVRGFVIDA